MKREYCGICDELHSTKAMHYVRSKDVDFNWICDYCVDILTDQEKEELMVEEFDPRDYYGDDI